MNVADIERRIMRRCIKVLLAAGYRLGVHDGEEITVMNSADKSRLFAALRTTDDDKLLVYQGGERIGWVHMVYGNSGWDLIADYTTNLEAALKPVEEYATTFEALDARSERPPLGPRGKI